MKKKEHFQSMHKSTKAIHIGELEPTVYGEVSVPIFQSSTFAFPSSEEGAARFSGEKPGYIYTRLGNPTVRALEETKFRELFGSALCPDRSRTTLTKNLINRDFSL